MLPVGISEAIAETKGLCYLPTKCSGNKRIKFIFLRIISLIFLNVNTYIFSLFLRQNKSFFLYFKRPYLALILSDAYSILHPKGFQFCQ